MKHKYQLTFLILLCLMSNSIKAQVIPTSGKEDTEHIMSDAYWNLWNPEVQAKIDRDIEQYRKSTAKIILPNVKEGTSVNVEQISHDFFFGASSFNFNQLGTYERNEKYKNMFGTLFNRATVAFYGRTLEMQPGRLRYQGEHWDSEEFWNNQDDPSSLPHWRRPAPDPVIDYMLNKGVAVHGHAMIYGFCFGMPLWLPSLLTKEEKVEMDKLIAQYPSPDNINSKTVFSDTYKNLTAEELDSKFPKYTKKLSDFIYNHVIELSKRYSGKVSSWDVVNESSTEFINGYLRPGTLLCKSNREIMPGDYTYKCFKLAEQYLPNTTWLNINDGDTPGYFDEIKSLVNRKAKIDIVGIQEHIWSAQNSIDISNGANIQTPENVYAEMGKYQVLNKPLCISEITIVAPTSDHKGEMIQAIIAKNLYRIWFSIKEMKAITWWNTVDNCALKGESSTSGLFTRDMTPKLSYYALDNLINHDWKTNIHVNADKNSMITFRGFKGDYRITYINNQGKEQTITYHLK